MLPSRLLLCSLLLLLLMLLVVVHAAVAQTHNDSTKHIRAYDGTWCSCPLQCLHCTQIQLLYMWCQLTICEQSSEGHTASYKDALLSPTSLWLCCVDLVVVMPL